MANSTVVEDDPFEEDIIFDQAGLLNNATKLNTAIRRVKSGKCTLFAKTLGLCGAFFGLGLCVTIAGSPFLPTKTVIERTSLSNTDLYLTISSGYALGSLLGGFLFDRYNRLFLLFLCLLIASVFITILPWCTATWLIETCMIVVGVALGFLDTGGNVFCLDLWGRNSAPFLQGMHFSFGLGVFFAPLVAYPFLESTTLSATTSLSSHPSSTHSTILPLGENYNMRSKRENMLETTDSIWKHSVSTMTPISTLNSPVSSNAYQKFLPASNKDSAVSSQINFNPIFSYKQEFHNREQINVNKSYFPNSFGAKSVFVTSDPLIAEKENSAGGNILKLIQQKKRLHNVPVMDTLINANKSILIIIKRSDNTVSENFAANFEQSSKFELTSSYMINEDGQPEKREEYINKPRTFDNDTEHHETFLDVLANKVEKYGFTKLQLLYISLGFFLFLSSVIFLGFLCSTPRDPKSKQEECHITKRLSSFRLRCMLVGLMGLFLLLLSGLQVSFGELILFYAIKSDLHLSESTGYTIATTFWGAFAAARFAAIFFSTGFSPTSMIILNFVVSFIGTVVLYMLANKIESMLWAGSILIGIGLAPMFPTGILWLERYIHVSNKVASVLVFEMALGQIVCLLTIDSLMIHSPITLMRAALVINILSIFAFAALWWLMYRQEKKYSAVTNDGYQLANQNDEEDMIDMSPLTSSVPLGKSSFGPSVEQTSQINGNLQPDC